MLEYLNQLIEGHLIFDPHVPRQAECAYLYQVLIQARAGAVYWLKGLIDLSDEVIVRFQHYLHEEYVERVVVVDVVLEQYFLDGLLEFVNNQDDVARVILLKLASFDHFYPN